VGISTNRFFAFLVVALAALNIASQTQKPPAGMVAILGATFEMGQNAADIPKLQEMFGIKRPELFVEETPRHRVNIGSFFMDKTEVTNDEFARFVRKHPQWRRDRLDAAMQNGKYLSHWIGNKPKKENLQHPIVFVTWHAAAAFCLDRGKRLPSEAEWEYAAGGPERTTFPWGNDMPDTTRANYGASGFKAPVKVGSYPPNRYGLFDIAGNVWEFLADEWSKYPADGALQLDPIAGGYPFADGEYLKVTTRRSLRGGSFGGGVVNLRVTYRDSHIPTNAVEHVGFRCVKRVNPVL
jgi:formylglycine-generating enzyme required for sulfatase activity